jgi:GcrA cell cycle regulator
MTWTDQQIELLQSLWFEGKSAMEIARELGQGVSRSAVMGKVNRLGFSGQARALPAAQPKRAQPSATPGRGLSQRRKSPSAIFEVLRNRDIAYCSEPDERPVERIVAPEPLRVTLEELDAQMCRWPLEDPSTIDLRYCGVGKAARISYCAYHQKLAYRDIDRRSDRARTPIAVGRTSPPNLRIVAGGAERAGLQTKRADWTAPEAVAAERIDIATAIA